MADEPEQKLTPWRWNKAKLEAAQLLAVDELTDQEIADKVDVKRQTLWGWKKRSEFAARVKELTDQLGEVAQRYAIGRRSRRVAALNNRWERMRKVIEERAADREMRGVPGGETGVLVHTMKSIGSGPAAEKVDEYEFDAALLKELREHEKQAAQELGQWTEKKEHTGKGGGPIEYADLSDAELDRRIAEVEARLREFVGGKDAAAEHQPPE